MLESGFHTHVAGEIGQSTGEMMNDDSDEFYDSDYNMDEESEDGDDNLYDTNISKNVADGDPNRNDSSDKDSSEEDADVVHEDIDFDEYKHSDGEKEGPHHPIFNPEVIFEPNFELGMIFGTKIEFKRAVQSHAIKTKRSLKFTKSAPTRMYVFCEDKKCSWNIHLNKMAGEETFQIRQYQPNHICDPSFVVKNVKSRWLSERFMKKFLVEPKRKVKVFREDAMDEIGCDISKNQAYRAKKMAMEKLEGNPDLQYSKLWDYAEELRSSNPGSTVIVHSEKDENGDFRFDRFYLCLDAVKKGFKICRPIIGVDGCHLKGPHKGILLTAVGVDANNNLYPISWAVVNREAKETWEWFLHVLKQDLGICNENEYTFMSDKQKGLIQAFDAVFPGADHRFCVRHLHENFKLAGYRGLSFKTALWRAAQASTPGEWKVMMDQLKVLNESAWKWLMSKPAKEWSKSHFNEKPTCDMLLNNVCESFNSSILDAREMPILTMLEWIREWMMTRFQKHRDISNLKWNGRICPRIKKILNKHAEKVTDCTPIKGDNTHYQIKCRDRSQYTVNLDERSCSCRLWDLSGIPCKHAISAINNQKENREDYVHEHYTVEVYKKSYAYTIKGINGTALWKETLFIPPLPPNMGRGVGRPTKARRRESDEPAQKLKNKTKGRKPMKLMRRQTTLNCTKCGEEGHNSFTCGRPSTYRKKKKVYLNFILYMSIFHIYFWNLLIITVITSQVRKTNNRSNRKNTTEDGGEDVRFFCSFIFIYIFLY